MTSLPVEVDIRTHGTLDDEITEVHVIEVVTAITQGERLELGYTRFLIGEELIRETLLVCIKTLIGIEYH